MTATDASPPTRKERIAHVWADLIPDPSTRAAWRAQFADHYRSAHEFYEHFTDPVLARQWAQVIPWHAPLAAYLHAHGSAPNPQTIEPAVDAASAEINEGAAEQLSDIFEEEAIRAGILLVHPRLTRADRDAFIAVGLTFAEVDHLLVTGRYDRDTLATLSGLR